MKGRQASAAILAAAALVWSGTTLVAQEIERTATPEETALVMAAIAHLGCTLNGGTVEKESDQLFEIDDAVCDVGQYDIKLDASYVVVSMTYDGPVDHDAAVVEATAEEVAGVTEAIEALNCEVGESPVEKETPNLFEIDDAQCEAGQFDIKLDGEFRVIGLTAD